jgi:hypothetical protein
MVNYAVMAVEQKICSTTAWHHVPKDMIVTGQSEQYTVRATDLHQWQEKRYSK